MAASLIPLVPAVIEGIMNFFGGGRGNPQPTQDPALREELRLYREKNEKLLKQYEEMVEKMKEKKIESFEDLVTHDKVTAAALIELARNTKPHTMTGNNFAVFGLTSTGKSTMLNRLVNSNVAETGAGETTMNIKGYPGTNFVAWDIPGRNDELSYFSMEYIAFWKGLTRRLVLITTTVKENTSMMKLLDAIGLHYDIVVNKFDQVDEDEREPFRQQVKAQIAEAGLKGVDHVFYVSAKHPKVFPDWLTMVDYLTNPPR